MEFKTNDILMCVSDHKVSPPNSGTFTKGRKYVVSYVYVLNNNVKIKDDTGVLYFFTVANYSKMGYPSLKGIMINMKEHRKKILTDLLK